MHVVVIGAGVFGAWTAHHLRLAGVRVTLVDAYGPGNSRSSSGDESRILRHGYGPDALYSRFVRQSLLQWRELAERRAGGEPPLWHACGVLWFGGNDPYTRATSQTLQDAGFRCEMLDSGTIRARFPQFAAMDGDVALLEPDGGVLMARRIVHALAEELRDSGVRLMRARVLPSDGSGLLERVRLTDGTQLAGDRFVFACGAWLPKVFPGLLAGRIRPTRQVVVYFGTPAGDQRFGPSQTPAWVDFPAGIYGVPELEHRGVKVGIDAHGREIDPDDADRVADAESIAVARAWLARRMPGMAHAPVVESRVCQYENTSTGDFVIDRHPECENVWIVGGGSGHGFKHGPAVGQYAARLVLTGADTETRFALAGKDRSPRRVVY